MYKEKLKDYESPTIDVLYLKFEGVVCQSDPLLYGNPGEAGDDFGDGGTYDF